MAVKNSSPYFFFFGSYLSYLIVFQTVTHSNPPLSLTFWIWGSDLSIRVSIPSSGMKNLISPVLLYTEVENKLFAFIYIFHHHNCIPYNFVSDTKLKNQWRCFDSCLLRLSFSFSACFVISLTIAVIDPNSIIFFKKKLLHIYWNSYYWQLFTTTGF